MYPSDNFYTVRIRLYPNADQKAKIEQTLEGCKVVRERYHAIWQNLYETASDKEAFRAQCQNKTIFYRLRDDYNDFKMKTSWLRDCDPWGPYNTLIYLNRTWTQFVNRVVRLGESPDLPQIATDEDQAQSYRAGRNTARLYGGTVFIPVLGCVECSIGNDAKNIFSHASNRGKYPVVVTVTRNPSGTYYVSLTYNNLEFPNVKLPEMAGIQRVVGIDLGLHDAIAMSHGEKIANHHYRDQADKQFRELRRRMNRYTPGSRNYNKTRTKIAKLREHINNQRANFIHKITSDLVMNYDIICIETLDLRGMLNQNRLLTTSMADAGLYEFYRQLEYKSKLYGKTVVYVPADYPSSQLCSNCGTRWSGTKDMSIRKWTCPVCGAVHDRDINAAKNILNEGLRRCNTVA